MAEDHDKMERLIALRDSLQDSLDQCEAFAAHGIPRVRLIEFIEYVDEKIKKPTNECGLQALGKLNQECVMVLVQSAFTYLVCTNQ